MNSKRKFLLMSGVSVFSSLLSFNSFGANKEIEINLPSLKIVDDFLINNKIKFDNVNEIEKTLSTKEPANEILVNLHNKIKSDFENDKIQLIDGWMISDAELILTILKNKNVYKIL